MGVVAEIGRLACCAWAPTGTHVAAGTYSGAIDTSFDASSSLEILQLDVANARVIASPAVRLPEKFASIGWGRVTRNHQAGLIAGGLSDGTVRVWDAATLLRPATDAAARDPNRALVMPPTTPAKHKGPVNSISFNSVIGHMFATGGADGQLLLWDMSNASVPVVRPPIATTTPSKDELLSVAWNPKIGHILASGSVSGIVSVFDVQNRKQLMNIRNPRGRIRASSLVWHPAVATQLLVACDEDDGTCAQLWDLRNATAPLETLSNHSPRGVMAAAWCPQDPELVLTSSRDGRSMLVSPTTGETIAELPKSSAWNFDVQWSPRASGVYLASSFDGRISFNSILTANAAPSVSAETANALAESFGADVGDFQSGMAVQSPRTLVAERESVSMSKPPQWLKRPACVSFGFGGRVVSVTSKSEGAVTMQGTVDRNAELETSLAPLEELLRNASPDDPSTLATYCSKAAADAESGAERAAWEVLSMQFQTDSRRKMLKYLGYSAAAPSVGDMSDQVFGMEHSPALANPVRPAAPEREVSGDRDDLDADPMPVLNGTAHAVGALVLDGPAPWDNPNNNASLLDSSGDPPEENGTPNGSTEPLAGGNGAVSEKPDFSKMDKSSIDALVKKSIIVGNFELAVDACLFARREAEALVIAHAGGPALWYRAQAEYLAKLSTVGGSGAAIGAATGARNKMDEFITSSASAAGESWKEALAVIITYSHGEDFVEACSALGQRLLEKQNFAAAVCCFVCACNTRMVATVWLRGRPAAGNMAAAIASRTDRLVALVGKIRVMTAAAALTRGERDIGSVRALDDISAGVLLEFGALLASQGDVAASVSYLNSISPTVSSVRGIAEDVQAQTNEALAMQQLETGGNFAGEDGGSEGYEHQQHLRAHDQFGTHDPYAMPNQSLVQSAPVGNVMQPAPVSSLLPPAPQQQWGANAYDAPPPVTPPVSTMPMPPAPPRPGNMFATSPSPSTPSHGGAYAKTFYPNQATSPSAAAPIPSSPAQTGYSVMTPAAPAAPPVPQLQAMPPPPPPPMMGGGEVAGLYQHSLGQAAPPASNGHAPMASMPPTAMPPPMPPVMSAPPVPAMPSFPAQSALPGIPSPGAAQAPGNFMPTQDLQAALPPPPPPPTDNGAGPMSYHANAQPGAGASLPPSSEVAVAKQRQKPVSSSGVPGGAPRRSPSTSSSLSSMASESALPLDKVDVRSIPKEQQVIVTSLRGSFQYALGRNSTMMFKKKMADVSKKLGRLLAQLNAKELDAKIVAQLVEMATGIGNRDYETAKRVTLTMSKTVHWESNKHWIQALNRLFDAVINGR